MDSEAQPLRLLKRDSHQWAESHTLSAVDFKQTRGQGLQGVHASAEPPREAAVVGFRPRLCENSPSAGKISAPVDWCSA